MSEHTPGRRAGSGPTARPPHAATVIQRLQPHPALMAQPKEQSAVRQGQRSPHPATVTRAMAQHAATVAQGRATQVTSARASRPATLQRMQQPQPQASPAEMWRIYFDAYDLLMGRKSAPSERWRNLFYHFEDLLYKAKESGAYEVEGIQAAFRNFRAGYGEIERSVTELEIFRIGKHRVLSLQLPNATVTCQMWDAETKAWYTGHSGHGKGQGEVPDSIWSKIPDATPEDFKDWAFGKNCAEVDCVIRAFHAGKAANNLESCYFVAYHIPSRRFIGPCKTCKTWVPLSRGRSYHPNG